MDVRDMEAEAKRLAALSPEERMTYAEQLRAHRTALGLEESMACRDVMVERARQVVDEGWTGAHDDEHRNGEMADAAACYAATRAIAVRVGSGSLIDAEHVSPWPWDTKWWKPKDRRRDLVRAGALIIAEIERLDRAREKPDAAKGE